MNRTKEEFIKRWRNHIAGMALFGAVSERQDGPLVRSAKCMEIPAETERLLGLMYDDLAAKKAAEMPATNGAPVQPPHKVNR